jgi:hypothetical protein
MPPRNFLRLNAFTTNLRGSQLTLQKGNTILFFIIRFSETDRYGRLLRYVYLTDGTFVNAELVRQGYAQVATYPPDVAHQELFVALQQEAREAAVGLWGDEVAAASGPAIIAVVVTTEPAATPAPLVTSTRVSTLTPSPLPVATALPTAIPVVTVTAVAAAPEPTQPPAPSARPRLHHPCRERW